MKINCNEDFKITLRLRDRETRELLSRFPEVDFTGRVKTRGVKWYPFHRRGRRLKNCRMVEGDEGALLVVLDSHGLNPGRVMAEMEFYLPDEDMPDGRRTVRTSTDDTMGFDEEVVLTADVWPGSVPEVTLTATAPFLLRSAYDIAVEQGYRGTAREYAAALAAVGKQAKRSAPVQNPYVCRGFISNNAHPGNVYRFLGGIKMTGKSLFGKQSVKYSADEMPVLHADWLPNDVELELQFICGEKPKDEYSWERTADGGVEISWEGAEPDAIYAAPTRLPDGYGGTSDLINRNSCMRVWGLPAVDIPLTIRAHKSRHFYISKAPAVRRYVPFPEHLIFQRGFVFTTLKDGCGAKPTFGLTEHGLPRSWQVQKLSTSRMRNQKIVYLSRMQARQRPRWVGSRIFTKFYKWSIGADIDLRAPLCDTFRVRIKDASHISDWVQFRLLVRRIGSGEYEVRAQKIERT